MPLQYAGNFLMKTWNFENKMPVKKTKTFLALTIIFYVICLKNL